MVSMVGCGRETTTNDKRNRFKSRAVIFKCLQYGDVLLREKSFRNLFVTNQVEQYNSKKLSCLNIIHDVVVNLRFEIFTKYVQYVHETHQPPPLRTFLSKSSGDMPYIQKEDVRREEYPWTSQEEASFRNWYRKYNARDIVIYML